ncbi:MAG TPA: hypothetical protein VE646_10845 [Actinomycetota bacterium]|nr:hypothetical protein [Actinomycetota bacterium]
MLYAYRGCPAAAGTGCQPGPDRFRIVTWPESAGNVPGQATLYDDSPNGDYDVDRAEPEPLARGTITVLR